MATGYLTMLSEQDLAHLIEGAMQKCIVQKPDIEISEIINRGELCKRLDITKQTAIRWERKGTIPCFRIGAAVRYNWPSVVEALEKQKTR